MKIIPIFLPYVGCKGRCVFCDQFGATGRVAVPTFEEIGRIIEEYSRTSSEYELAFYGGTFTALSVERMREYLEFVRNFRVVKKLRVSTRPDEVTPEKLAVLREYGVETVEVGVQSFDEEVLTLSGRGYGTEVAERACRMVKEWGFTLGVHLMLGLPGSNKKIEILSALRAVECGVDLVRLHPTLVLKGAELYKMYTKGEYKPLSLEEAVELCSDLLTVLEGWGVKVVRIGYYIPPDQAENVAAGPFDPSLGDKVRKRVVEKIFERLRPKKVVVPSRYRGWLKDPMGAEVFEGEDFSFDELGYSDALFLLGKEVVECLNS